MNNFFRRLFGLPRHFNEEELEELRQLYQLVNGEIFKLHILKGNTAILPKGLGGKNRDIEFQEILVKLLENKRTETVTKYLARLGYPQNTVLTFSLRDGKVYKAQRLSAPVQSAPSSTSK